MSHLIVIGSGPAGTAAALEAAGLGARTTLVGAEPVGGRAVWHSLLPSKVYLTAADHLGEARHNPALGLGGGAPRPDLPVMRERIARLSLARSERDRARLEQRGVRLVSGKARFADARTIEVAGDQGSETLAFDTAVIATGSIPVFPPAIRPDGRRVLAPRLAGRLAAWPESVIVVGGGVTGAEFAYFFERMGVAVTWLTDLDRMLPRTDRDLAGALEAALADRGATLIHDAPVAAVEAGDDDVTVLLNDGRTLTASHAFLALGRRPDVDDLGLDLAGIATADGVVTVDAHGRTSAPAVFAAGDVTGPPYVANRAEAQARAAVRAALGAGRRPFRPQTIIEAVYTDPQVAQVGLTETAAAAAGRRIGVLRAGYGEGLKPHLTAAPEGLVKLIVDPEDGRLLGGGAVGDRAADVLAPVAVALAAGMTVEDLAEMFPAYPSLAELVGLAARSG